MGLKRHIIENIVKPAERAHYDLTQGEVVAYDEKRNKAKVEIIDPRGGGLLVLDNVPVQLGSGGVHSSGPFPGDTVWISFQNRNPLFPKIVSLADKDYKNNTREKFHHGEAGGYATDLEEVEIKNYIPVTDAWMTRSSSKNMGFYKDTDPYEELQLNIEDVPYYRPAEVGLTHPENGSTIKISDDGTISIFTGVGEGILISPKNHKVSIFSRNSMTNEEEVVNKMEKWTVECQDEIQINAKGNIRLRTEDYMIFQAKEFVFQDTDGKRTKLQEVEK